MARFNEETPDDPNVRYFSYGAYFEPSWSNAFRIPWGVVYEREGAPIHVCSCRLCQAVCLRIGMLICSEAYVHRCERRARQC